MHRDLVSDQVSFRLDATMQMKGVGSEYNGRATVKASYYYLGLSPQIGLRFSEQFSVWLGAEANRLLSSVHAWGKTYPFEFGGLARLSYQIGQFGLETSYCKGFTKYDSLETISLPGGPSTNDFYNQTIQLGIFYRLGL